MKTFPSFLRKPWLPLAFLTVFLLGWYFGLPAEKDAAASDDDDTIWTCSMHPQIRQPNPGLCPICSMDLIPLVPGSGGGLRQLEISPEAAALMDLRVSPVVRQPATVHVDFFGKIAYDERKVTTTTARMGGRLDRFFIDYTGTQVRKGDHIAEIYSPDLVVAQQGLIQAAQGLRQARQSGTSAAVQTQERLLKSARERLRLLQLTDEQIDSIAQQEEPTDHVTLFSPQDGVVTKRHVVEGAYVKEGEPLFSVAAMDTVWLNLEAYESDLSWLKFGQDVAFTVEALPGEVFHGRVAYIDPELDPMRRVVRVRVNVPNERRVLKPGMFARATIDAEVTADGSVIDPELAGKWISPMHPEIVSDTPGQCTICGMDLVPAEELGFIQAGDEEHADPLLVPASAVLRTGKRATVYVRLRGKPSPEFEGREIVLGPQVGQYYVVESGLTEGERVVTRGAFKIDSELQIQAKPSMMNRNAGLVETPATEADASLEGHWDPIPRALGRLARAAAQGDQGTAHEAMADLEAAIDQVNTESFDDKTAADWKEFSQRLRNALVGAHQGDAEDLMSTYQNIRLAVEEAARFLGLPAQIEGLDQPVDEAELASLRRALDAYYPFAKALASDDEAAAKSTRDALAEALDALDIPADSLRQADTLDSLRQALKPMSEMLIAQIKKTGTDKVGNAYVVHCPMAFDNKGADWLSPASEILNPYFGDKMLRCGTVKANLSFEPTSKPESRPANQTPADEDHSNH